MTKKLPNEEGFLKYFFLRKLSQFSILVFITYLKFCSLAFYKISALLGGQKPYVSSVNVMDYHVPSSSLTTTFSKSLNFTSIQI